PRGCARWAGLFPHAPYTVCAEAYRACAREATGRGGLLVTHAAETAEEIAFCVGGDAGLVEQLYASLPVAPPPCPGARPVDWLDRLGLLGPRTVLVHAVHLAAAEVERVARRGSSVVLCPRSNRRFGSARAPGRALLEAGVSVGLGTDSRLSAGDLDLWRDIAAAVEDFGWTPAQAVSAATRGSAQAFRLADRGTLAPGRRADIVAVRLAPGRDPWERVLAGAEIRALWRGGEECFSVDRGEASGLR
ncbi:MAG: amidohydrolase family protein, partial [Proteobacteria bacterium]|nr:amidohydrolase family protein [Pseudomonadota bacterium]